jgi:hypothetical protein
VTAAVASDAAVAAVAGDRNSIKKKTLGHYIFFFGI